MNRKQRGITAIETIGALAVGTLMLIGLTQMIDTSIEDSKGQQAATYHAQVVAAARMYMSDHHGALQGLTAGGAIHPISVQNLRDERYLPPGFALANVYGQSACVLVRQRPPTAAGVVPLDALVVSTNGDKIEDRHLAFVASQAGQGSGYIREGAPGTAQGSTWGLDTTEFRGRACAGGRALDGSTDDAGHLASRIFHDGQLTADFLHRRRVDDRPDLNTMFTPIRMDPSTVIANSDIGGPCDHFAISIDENGRLVSCVDEGGGTMRWRRGSGGSFWKEPVNNYAELSDSTKVPSPENGEVRMTLDTARAFMYNGSTWTALAVDQSGNFRVPETLYVTSGDIRVETGGIYAACDITAERDLYAHRDLHVTRDATTSTLDVEAWMRADHFWLLNHTKRPGDPCNYIGPDGKTHFPHEATVLHAESNVLLTCGSDNIFKFNTP